MSVKRAEALIGQSLSSDGSAIDPATITMVITILTGLVQACRNRGVSQRNTAAMVKDPGRYQRSRFYSEFRKQLGAKEYRKRGGSRYAQRALAASKNATPAECLAFVREVDAERN